MSEASVHDTIKQQIESNPVILFMKGTPDSPMCGFSAQVVHILNQHGVKYNAVDVLKDWDIREGIKEFSNWPTIPQLYVGGKFVGGCDIVMQLERNGELSGMLKA
jgi:monothiol glutaredoxin